MALIPAYRTGPMASLQQHGDTKLETQHGDTEMAATDPPVPKSVLLGRSKSSHAFQESWPAGPQEPSFRLGPPVPKSILRSKSTNALEGFPFELAPVPKSKPVSFLGFAPEMHTKRPPTDEPDNARATKAGKSE